MKTAFVLILLASCSPKSNNTASSSTSGTGSGSKGYSQRIQEILDARELADPFDSNSLLSRHIEADVSFLQKGTDEYIMYYNFIGLHYQQDAANFSEFSVETVLSGIKEDSSFRSRFLDPTQSASSGSTDAIRVGDDGTVVPLIADQRVRIAIERNNTDDDGRGDRVTDVDRLDCNPRVGCEEE